MKKVVIRTVSLIAVVASVALSAEVARDAKRTLDLPNDALWLRVQGAAIEDLVGMGLFWNLTLLALVHALLVGVMWLGLRRRHACLFAAVMLSAFAVSATMDAQAERTLEHAHQLKCNPRC